MSIVSDTGPLIALAKVDRLGLLERAFAQVQIPPTVHRELLSKRGQEASRLDAALETFVVVVEKAEATLEVQAVTQQLDVGEREAIALSAHLGVPLLLDDREGRRAARALGLSVFGTVGFLIQAQAAGHVPRVTPLLEDMRRQGYWLSDELLDLARRLAGE